MKGEEFKELRAMKHNRYILSLFVLLLVVFLIGKLTFLGYNHNIETITPGQFFAIWWHGLLLDIRTSAIALLVPILCCYFMPKHLRWVLVPYFIVLACVVGIIIAADTIMYEFWQFKLSAVVLSYAASPEGTTNSVSIAFLITRLLMVLAFILMVAVPTIWLTPKAFHKPKPYWMLLLTLAVTMLPINVGTCYHRAPLFHCHAATNPVYRFLTSFSDARAFSEAGNTASANNSPIGHADGSSAAVEAYRTSSSITDTLLRTTRPDILIVQLESFGGKFVEELGGIPGVAPNLSRLIPEGIFWDHYYSNSFRTDRGTVCAYSGTISLPTVSPMKETRLHDRLPSMARSLYSAGYQTGYLYAGAMTNMGKYQYLAHMGFEALMDDTFFTPDELNSSWGAHDGNSAMKLYRTIAEIDTTARWFMVYQTISSHEPWDVPYQRLDDKVLNAFAYTDQCLGELIDSMRTLPVWDNLLVIVIPDHGYLYQQTFDDSEFFHSPMLWLGGAIREPRRIPTLMNQSDIAATLLAQMQLPHDDFPWSRNVLSPDYRPFVYCNYPAGLLYKDETGETLYDLSAGIPLPVGEPADSTRLSKALSILRQSYRELNN